MACSFGLILLPRVAMGQSLGERCLATAFNRVTQVNSDGSFSLANVPVPSGAFRVRIVCQDESEFQELIGAPFRGSTGARIHSDRVTLAPSATVIEHLAQLLGDDRTLVFSILKGRAGLPERRITDVR